MPIYGYRCGSCGHEFEILQKMSDPPLTTCPKCAGKLSKMMYAAGVIYKGSGYYSTDYKGGKSGGGSSSDKSTSSTADKGDSNGGATSSEGSGGESKPAAESKSESNSSKSDSSTEKAS